MLGIAVDSDGSRPHLHCAATEAGRVVAQGLAKRFPPRLLARSRRKPGHLCVDQLFPGFRGMDRAVIIEQLVLAQKHIVEGKLRVRQQHEYVARQASKGEDAQLSKRLLARFEAVLAMHIADRDRLIRELDGPTRSEERARA
jgi:hypothetical protein